MKAVVHCALVAAGAMIVSLPVLPAIAQDERVIEHALGKTVIQGLPERVVVLSDFVDLEYVLALDVLPVAYGATGAWSRGALEWQSAAADVPHIAFSWTDLPLEQIVSYDPDLIIGMDTQIIDALPSLEAIAPVVALDWTISWRDGIELVGQALGREALAAERIAETEALIAEMAARLDGLDGKAVMIGSLYGDMLYIIGTGPLADQFSALGVNFIPAPNGGAGPVPYSLEQVDQLADADILLSLATDPEAMDRLEAFVPFQRLRAVEGNAHSRLDTITSSAFADNFSPLSAPWVLPKIEALLLSLAAGEGAVAP